MQEDKKKETSLLVACYFRHFAGTGQVSLPNGFPKKTPTHEFILKDKGRSIHDLFAVYIE